MKRATPLQCQAQNMVRFRDLYGAMPSVVVPEVLLEFSGKRVITSEWINGEKVIFDVAWTGHVRGRYQRKIA